MRFGVLGPEGIFNTLDRAGVMNHRVEGVGDIEAAMSEPPANGRAHVRGEAIRRLSGTPDVKCDWQRIVQFKECQVLDLTDPFVNVEVWRQMESSDVDATGMPLNLVGALEFDSGSGDSVHPSPYSRRLRAYECFGRGEFAEAEELLRGCVAEGFELASNHCHLARALMMMDREAEARAEIEQAWVACADCCAYVPPRVMFFRCVFAVLNGTEFASITGQIKTLLNTHGAHSSWTIRPVLDHLRSRLGRSNHRFLSALAAALSDPGKLRALEQFPQWREAGV